MRVILSLFLYFLVTSLFAEGSKDLYPLGVKGARAYLVSGRPLFENGEIGYAAHYVWVKQGEIIAVASSAQNIGNGRIEVTSPSGVLYATTNNNIGRIMATNQLGSRAAELAGPRDGYTPFEIPVNEEGIWKVQFYASVRVSNDGQSPVVQANANWNQYNDSYIAAWDVSVRDITNVHWVKGRVFTHSLNLFIHSDNLQRPDGSGGFYGKNFVLTNDAVLYKVDANGNHGLGFAYFANNLGFIDGNGNPLYKSINHYNKDFHYPYLPDTEKLITHKLFYNIPDPGLPEESSGQYPGNNTWLLNDPVIAEVKNIRILGIEGNENHLSKKGAWIEFEASHAGRYQIIISSKSSQKQFVSRKIIHSSTLGLNKSYWNGLDGDGDMIPEGKNYPIDVNISFLDGEVHFPYLDMEVNPQGVLIERFDLQGNNLGDVDVYWDDSDISPGIPSEQSSPLTNLIGIKSSINGHRWGSYKPTDWSRGSVNNWYGSHSFGNGKGMDTWTYSIQLNNSVQKDITVDIHDLKIVSITSDKDDVELDEKYMYTVVLKNEGPSDAADILFTFNVPTGISIEAFETIGSCGEIKSSHLVDHYFTARLDISNGCEFSFRLTVKVANALEDYYYRIPVKATVVRSSDSTDPDATSSDIAQNLPGSAEEECQQGCNNILWNDEVSLLEPLNERGKIGLLKRVRYLDSDGNGAISAGDHLEYEFLIKNLGEVILKNISLTDEMFSSNPVWNPDQELFPLQEENFRYLYALTEADIQRKTIYNSAKVRGYNPRNKSVVDVSGTDFENDTPTLFAVETLPNIKLRKVITNRGTGEDGQFTLGDRIQYRFEIKHEGEAAVTDIKLTDLLISDDEIFINDIVFNGVTVYSESFLVTEEAILAGKVTNSASIVGIESKYNTISRDISGLTFDDDKPTETAVAHPYITSDDLFEMYQGEKIKLDILTNDNAGSSKVDKIVFLDDFQYGTISLERGIYYYEPFLNVNEGQETISYQVYDKSRLTSNESTMKIIIRKTEAIAKDDSIKMGYNYRKTLYPLRNDYAKGSELDYSSLVVTSYPQNGILWINNNGSVEYTPNSKFTGRDWFEYQIADLNGNLSDPAKFVIEVNGFYIPNVITPNHDGFNDSFYIIGANLYDKVELWVFNRSGIEIYKSLNYENDWIPDNNIEDGTYYFILKAYREGKEILKKRGTILILRKPVS